ncbi:hypothetical protein ElyMa_005585300 [Elysia marginata]|uniref:Uncharacterized protein n=1 Tax=Elysia marginata TaxID=1093978 RepID=A0AAV4F483_9GAST|nr:hypothetical protein ElyMa_005585300 [Elysia marginata]
MPILTENPDRPACLPGTKDEPFLPSIKPTAGSPRAPPLLASSRENKPSQEHSTHNNINGNTSSRKTTTTTANNNNNNILSSNGSISSRRNLCSGDSDNNGDMYISGNAKNNNKNINAFTDINNVVNSKDSLSSRRGQYPNHGGDCGGHKNFFSAPASESSTPFKLPSIDRSKSNSVSSLVSDRYVCICVSSLVNDRYVCICVSSLVSDRYVCLCVSSLVSERHVTYCHRQSSIRGPSRDRRARLCRSPSCPSNLGSHWNDYDEDDFDDEDDANDDHHHHHVTQEGRPWKHYVGAGEISSMITPDTARLPTGEQTMQSQESSAFYPSQKRPFFEHREDSCTATNSSIKLPSIFPSRGSHNSSFLTTNSSMAGFGVGGGPEEIVTAESSAVTSRDSSPFAFKREPTFFSLSQGRRDSVVSQAVTNASPAHTLLPPDVASRVAAKLSLASSGLSPRLEMDTEYEEHGTLSSTGNTTRSSHHGGQQQQQNCKPVHQAAQSQQSTALLLPLSSTADLKLSPSGLAASSADSGRAGAAGKRKRKKNGSKSSSSHELGEHATDGATERLLREKLGAIERRHTEGYSPTREPAHPASMCNAEEEGELSDFNLIERVQNETSERNSVAVGDGKMGAVGPACDTDSKMSAVGPACDTDSKISGVVPGPGATDGGTSAKPPVYQNTPTRIKTEKKIASVKA